MADDFPAELERAYHRIEQLEQDGRQAQAELNSLQYHAWWQTYNAALTGLSARSDLDQSQVHGAATYAAEIAHGKRRQ